MNLLEQFVNDGIEELLLVVGSQPRAKNLGRWIIYKNQNVMLSDWGKLTQSLLSEKQKTDLDLIGTTSGQFVQKTGVYQYQFFQKSDLFKFYIIRQDNQVEEFQIPQRGVDFLKKSSALTLFVGIKEAKVNLMIEQSLKLICQEQLQNILVLNQIGQLGVAGNGMNLVCMNYESIDDLRVENLYRGFDCVVFIEPDRSIFHFILNLLDTGIKVILKINSKTIVHAIQKLLSYYSTDQNSQLRVVDQLDAIFLQMRHNQDCFVHEIVFLNEQFRQLVHEQKWTEIEQFLSQVNDHPNLISLNQSLLQLILKRKIDLRKAFELTRYPSQLDLMLKKVGV